MIHLQAAQYVHAVKHLITSITYRLKMSLYTVYRAYQARNYSYDCQPSQLIRQAGLQISAGHRKYMFSAPYVFFLFPVLVFQRGAPKSPRSPENVIGPQDLKIEAPKCGGPNDLFVPCFSAGSKQRGALKSPRPPKAKPQTKKNARPKS